MLKSTISGWVRQARHRARKHGLKNDLEITDVEQIIESYKACAYCTKPATTLDHPFPLRDSAPNVPANVLPACDTCKSCKKHNDLVWMFNTEYVSEERYVSLIERMLKLRGSIEVKQHIKKITGRSDD